MIIRHGCSLLPHKIAHRLAAKSQSVYNRANRFVAIIDSNPMPPQIPGSDERCSRTSKTVQYQVSQLGRCADDLLEHFNIFFCWIAGNFDVLVMSVFEIQPDVLDGNS